MGVFGGGGGALLYLVISGIDINRGRRGAKARDTQTAMCFQSQAFGSLHSLLPNAPENNPTVFFPPACWKWPNHCQEEECEAFPGAVRDVRALRRPLRFRQLGYSRAHSTQTPNSWSQLLPRSSSKTIPKNTRSHLLLSSLPLHERDFSSHLSLYCLLLWAEKRTFYTKTPNWLYLSYTICLTLKSLHV